MALARDKVRAFYDGFGVRQDSQAFYEDAALAEMIAHADFGHARRVFELGCGTGRFAAQLLASHLPAGASYLGVDLSAVMVDLAGARLRAFGARAEVRQTDGSLRIALADHSVDRVIATYVLDLLGDSDIRGVFDEAHRVLEPDGKLCIVSLSEGVTPASRLVAALWKIVYRFRPTFVGGCRPLMLVPYLNGRWRAEYRRVVTPFAVPSEILIATPLRY